MVARRSHRELSEKTQKDDCNPADQPQTILALSAASAHFFSMNGAPHYASLASELLKVLRWEPPTALMQVNRRRVHLTQVCDRASRLYSTGVDSFRDRSRLLPPVFRHQAEEKGSESKPADQAQTECPRTVERGLDLHRFRSGLLRAILAIKETGYGSNTQR